MAHYAFLDKDNFVTQVIPGKDETETIDGLIPEEWYSNYTGQRCVRTSYNNRIRKHYAGIGYFYDEVLDAFIFPKCHDEAILNEITCTWNCDNPDHDPKS